MEDRQEDVVAEEVDLVEEAGTFFLVERVDGSDLTV